MEFTKFRQWEGRRAVRDAASGVDSEAVRRVPNFMEVSVMV